MTLFSEIEAELKLFTDRAKAAWDRGEKWLHDEWHGKAAALAEPTGAIVTPSGKEDGVLVVTHPNEADATPAEPEVKTVETPTP
jgi:hypothetical protein